MKSIFSSDKWNLISVIICMCLIRTVLLNLYENVRFNHMLDGFPLKQITGISFAECWSNCEARVSCKSVNYKRQFHQCSLNKARDTGEIQLLQFVGFVYKANDNQPNNVQKCGNGYCPDGKVCSGNICEVQECPAFSSDPSTTEILGNMFSCGNKVIVKCRNGYIWKKGNDVISSECQENGTWSSTVTINCTKGMKNCKEYFENGDTATGFKTIFPDEVNPVEAYCVMDVDGGGWTVIQQRQSPSDFYKIWREYQNGFGDKTNFWLGLENIYRLTAQGAYELRVGMNLMDGTHAIAKYDDFKIGNESTSYALNIRGYSFDPRNADPGDSLAYHNGMKFSTKDRDNDRYSENCAQVYQGAWWYDACHRTNLNGVYGSNKFAIGMNWKLFTGYYESLKYTRMMIRPK